MNETLAVLMVAQCLGLHMQEVAPLLYGTTTTTLKPLEIDKMLRILDKLRPTSEASVWQAGYQQCKKEVRYEVFGVGDKPHKSPAPAQGLDYQARVTYPIDDGNFNLSATSAQIDFYVEGKRVKPGARMTQKEGNTTVCKSWPQNITLVVWPMKGIGGNVAEANETILFGDL